MDGLRLVSTDFNGSALEGDAPRNDMVAYAFEHAPIGMVLVGVGDGDVVDPGPGPAQMLLVNQALCRLVGRTAEALEGAAPASILHPDDVAADHDAMTRLLDGDTERFQIEQRLMHADGRAVWVMLHASLARDALGRPLYCIRQLQDIEERRRFEGELGYLVDHDPLTGLINRRGFVRELNRELAHVRRYGAGAAVLFIDLDDFKSVNDSLGHSVGDALMVSVAAAVSARLRETDLVGRLGGDEFAVLLPHASAAEAVTLSHSLLSAVREAAEATLPEVTAKVTASIGVTAIEAPGAGVRGDDILIHADLAMYAAKHAGKNRVRVASDSDLERMRTGLTWSGRLREAVDHGGFELHGQPIIDLASGSVVEWELLLRLPGENAELIPPAQFLATAERSGLSLELDRWVLLRAIDLLAEHHRAGVELNLSVNLCGRSLDDLELPAFIQRSLDERQVDPARLGLEVAETAAIASVGRARAFAAQLSEVGCGFAFDDFGAGFGAFHYLKHLPFDSVKIDGEFIQNLASSSTDQLILDSIVQMCQGLGKRTIAKFVGDQSTVEVLRRHGVDSAQGYHLGRPLPIREAFGDARA